MAEQKPAASLVDTPEFKAAVAEAVAEAIKAAKPATGPMSDDVIALFRQMGMTMAEISDQGTDKPKRLPPEVIEQRAQAQKRLDEMLHGVREYYTQHGRGMTAQQIRDQLPWYRCVSTIYLGERKIVPFVQDPGTKRAKSVEFRWLFEPNHAMRPINDLAKRIYEEFLASRGELEKVRPKNYHVKEGQGWLTDKGLYVEGDAPHRRAVDADRIVPRFDNDLGLPEAIDPEAPYVHVLGTVAEPALQNAAPQFAGMRR